MADLTKPLRWCCFFWPWGVRVHAWGHGFCLQYGRPAYFSERYGYVRVRRAFGWALIFV